MHNLASYYGFQGSNEENVTKVTGFSLVHGAGHNAGTRGHGAGQGSSHIYGGIMTEGNEVESARRGKPLNSLAAPGLNREYIQAMENHFGTNKAQANYLQNQREFHLDPAGYLKNKHQVK